MLPLARLVNALGNSLLFSLSKPPSPMNQTGAGVVGFGQRKTPLLLPLLLIVASAAYTMAAVPLPSRARSDQVAFRWGKAMRYSSSGPGVFGGTACLPFCVARLTEVIFVKLNQAPLR